MTKMQLIEKLLAETGVAPSRHAKVTGSLMKRSKGFLERYVASQIQLHQAS